MPCFGLDCFRIVLVAAVIGKGCTYESDTGLLLSDDYLVDQLSEYLKSRSHLASRNVPISARNNHIEFSKKPEKLHRFPQIRVRPHSKLLEQLESEDDLIGQKLEDPREEEELKKFARDNHAHFKSWDSRTPKDVIHRPDKVHPLDGKTRSEKSVHSQEIKNLPKIEKKFGYLPSDPEFFAPVPLRGEEEILEIRGTKSFVTADAPASTQKTTVASERATSSSPSSTETTTSVRPSTWNAVENGRTQSPENYEIVEGYFQKHNLQEGNSAVSLAPEVSATAQRNLSSYLENSGDPVAHAHIHELSSSRTALTDFYFTVFVAGCTAALVGALIAGGVCWYRLQRDVKAAADVEYPAAYRGSHSNSRVTTPESRDRSPTGSRGSIASVGTGDRKLAQSAHMFHYQHQKQQVLAMERSAETRHGSASGMDSDDDNDEGDYTVYECPGLAPTGEMEVKNPMFLDDPTPLTHTFKKESSDL